MPPRRAYGTGSIHQLPNGSWRGTVEHGYTATGARKRSTVTAPTEAKARTKLNALRKRLADESRAETTVNAKCPTCSHELTVSLRSQDTNACRPD